MNQLSETTRKLLSKPLLELGRPLTSFISMFLARRRQEVADSEPGQV